MNSSFLACLSVCALTILLQQPILADEGSELRTWSIDSPSGKQELKARLVSIAQGKAVFRDEQDKEHQVSLRDLAEADRKDALIQRIGSGVVAVHPKDVYDQPTGVGSGFVIGAGGLIVTNYHVVRGAGSLEVQLRDGEDMLAAECVGVDQAHDAAILRVAKFPEGIHILELAGKELPRQGDSVWTIGHPQGLKDTVSWGDVNAVRKTTDLPAELRQFLLAPADARWIQTDAVLAQGSSGGPLLNLQGQALGMNTFIVGPQLGFALHLEHIRQDVEQAGDAEPLALPLPPAEGESSLAWICRDAAPILKEYGEATQQLGRLARTKTPAELEQELRNSNARFRDQFMKIVRKDPASWPAFQGLYFAAGLAADGSEQGDQALTEICDLLLKHHLPSRELGRIAEQLSASSSEVARQFCLKIIDSSPHKPVQAHAAIAAALGRIRWLSGSGTLALADLQQSREQAEAMLKRIEKEFADVPVGQATAKQLAQQLRLQLEALKIGLPSPEIKGVDNDGKEFKLSDYKGKVVVLDFFADWCPYCKQMYPAERKLVEKMKDRPFALLGVNTDNQAKLEELVTKGTVTWRTWADGQQGPIATDWGVGGFPQIYLIDHQGVVRKLYGGVPDEKDFQESIETLVKEAEQGQAKPQPNP